MVTRTDLHRLVDEVPESHIDAVAALLRGLVTESDPFLLALAEAEDDDEPFTEEDREAVREARAEFAAGNFMTGDAARRALRGE